MTKIFVYQILVACLFLILPGKVHAATCGGKAAGSIEFSSGWKICNGTTGAWDSIDLSSATGSCSNNSVDYDSSLGKHKFCVSSAPKTPSCATSSIATGYCSISNELSFTASDGAANDNFGNAVAANGYWMVVGAYNKSSSTGAVYIYKKVADSWIFDSKLTASDAATGDEFGVAVAVSGNTVAVGARSKTGTFTAQGAVYIFTNNGTAWSQQQKLISSSPSASQSFGQALDVYNNTLVIGTYSSTVYVFDRSGSVWSQSQSIGVDVISVGLYGDTLVLGDYQFNTSAGRAVVYRKVSGTWTFEAQLLASDTASAQNFGRSVDIGPGAIVVGAVSNNAAYYFTRSGSTWTQQKKLTPSDGGSISFGNSVALSGNYILVGAPNYGGQQGAAYIFYGSGSTWNQLARQIPSDVASNDGFGLSVAFVDTSAIVGSYYKMIGSNTQQGAAYIIPLIGLKQTFTGTGIAASDMFGAGDQPMSIDGDTLVVGAYAEDTGLTDVGAAYVFTRSASGIWSQQQKITPTTRVASEQFGKAVAVFGNTLVIGAPGFGTNQGRIYIFTRAGSIWTQTAGSPYTGTAATNQNFGKTVDINGDTIAVGQSGATVSATTSGLVRVYRWDGTTLSAEQVINRPVATNAALFGDSLDLDGNVLVVGSPGNSVAGRVWVFNRNVTVWDAGTELVNSSAGHITDSFGRDVYYSSGTVAIGRPSSAASGQAQSVIVYTGSGTSWILQQTFSGNDVAGQPDFGNQVAIYGDQMVVSSAFTNSNKGAVYFFKRVGTTWTQAAKFISPNQFTNELFGNGVAIVDGFILVTSPGFSGNSGNVFYYGTTGDPVQTCQYAGYAAAGPTGSGASNPTTNATINLSAGQTLLVCLTGYSTAVGASNPVTLNGTALAQDAATSGTVSAYIYSYYASSAVVNGTLSITMATAANNRIYRTAIVNGLVSASQRDGFNNANGAAATTASSGLTATTTMNQEFVFGCIAQNYKGADVGTWSDSLTQIGYSATAAGGGGQGPNVSNQAAYKVVSATGQFKAEKTSLPLQPWAAAVATYKTSAANSGTTTSCTSYGACSIAGQLDFSPGNGMLWCDGSVWRQIAVTAGTPTLGSFSIAGVTGGTDTNSNHVLSDLSSTVDVSFTSSTGATAYDVTLKTYDGITTKCSVSNAAASPVSLSGCSLVSGENYKIFITAKAGADTLAASNDGWLESANTVSGGYPDDMQVTSSNSGTSAVTSSTIVFASAVKPGNTVLIAMTGRDGTDTITSVTGLGATWTKIHSVVQTGNMVEIWKGVAVTSGTTVTIANSVADYRFNYGMEIVGINDTTVAASAPRTAGGWTLTANSLGSISGYRFYFAVGVVDKQATLSSGPTLGYAPRANATVGTGTTYQTSYVGTLKTTASDGAHGTTWNTTGTGTPTSAVIQVSFSVSGI